MSQESRGQPRIASGQFAIDSQHVAHGRHVASPGIVGGSTGDSNVPGLQQRVLRSVGDGFPDQALDMQRALAHRFARRTLRRCCSQCTIHGGCERDDVLARPCGEHDGKIVTNRLELAVRGQQRRPQTRWQCLLGSVIVRQATREMKDDL